MEKIKVGILGATGTVGQRFIQLLENHPWFELTALAASKNSSGKTYEESVKGRWNISSDIPEYVRKIVVSECYPEIDCSIVFSALDSSIAGEVETKFAEAGYFVFSNSRNHRMDKEVPLMVSEVNANHLELVKSQNFDKGFIVTNPNCSTIGLVMALKPLQDAFGIKSVQVTTQQALSGAGFPGVPPMEIQGNVIPFIGGEEEKMETETQKILGRYLANRIENISYPISAQCTRVPVKDGHLESVSISLDSNPSIDEIKNVFRNFNSLKDLNLPTAPNPPIEVREEDDRPQPRLDVDLQKGMGATIGRLRTCPVVGYKFFVLTHNTIRGAAGASILNAELCYKKGLMG